MPIYEYRCQSCNHEMEALVRGGKEPETCPQCEGQLARKISRAGVIFKGSGFYVNDSRGSTSGGGKTSNGSTSESSKSDGAAESKGGEAKASSESASPAKSESASKSGD